MALVDNAFYVNYGDGSAGAGKKSWFDVTAWATGTVKAAGALLRQNATPSVGNERVFVCIVAGTTHATTEPTWTVTRGAKTTDNTVTWQECTGIAGINGDLTNTPNWTTVKNTSVTLGQVIQRNNAASLQICSTAGTAGNGSEPAFSDTAGTTTADNTVTWTSIGAVSNFTGWQAPHARLQNAMTTNWAQAGKPIYIGNNHAETQSSTINMTCAMGTENSPVTVLCVDRAGSLPPVAADLKTTASISTTGNTNMSLAATGGSGIYYYGITFQCGSGAVAPTLTVINNNVAAQFAIYEACQFSLVCTGNAVINLGSTALGSKLTLKNTSLKFGAVGQSVSGFCGDFQWENTASAIQGSVPTNLFSFSNPNAHVRVNGVDLSAMVTGKTLFNFATNSGITGVFNRCSLGVGYTFGTPNHAGVELDMINCDTGGTNYVNARYWYQGTQTQETTIIRTGGASDGTQGLSWKLVTTANSKWYWPFESQPITLWNESTSAITDLTIYGTTTGGGVPNNDDIWAEVEYLGSSSNSLGSFQNTTKTNILSASATTNNSSDASTWAGGGAGNGFKIVFPSFTPAQKGPIRITIKVAKVSATYYIDPRPSMTGAPSGKQYIVAPGAYVNEQAHDRFSGGLFL